MIEYMLTWLGNNKDALEALQSALAAAGILVAGIWTYQLFVAKRQKFPRAVMEHQLVSWPLNDNKVLLRVTVRIRNQGDVLLRLREGFTWVQQLQPLSAKIEEQLSSGDDIVNEGQTETQWPLVKERIYFSGGHDRQLEPGEPDELNADFVLDSSVTQVLVYSHLENEHRSWWARVRGRRKIGWSASLVSNIPTGHEPSIESDMSKDTQSTKEAGTRQGAAKPRPVSVTSQPLPTAQGEAKPKPPPATIPPKK